MKKKAGTLQVDKTKHFDQTSSKISVSTGTKKAFLRFHTIEGWGKEINLAKANGRR